MLFYINISLIFSLKYTEIHALLLAILFAIHVVMGISTFYKRKRIHFHIHSMMVACVTIVNKQVEQSQRQNKDNNDTKQNDKLVALISTNHSGDNDDDSDHDSDSDSDSDDNCLCGNYNNAHVQTTIGKTAIDRKILQVEQSSKTETVKMQSILDEMSFIDTKFVIYMCQPFNMTSIVNENNTQWINDKNIFILSPSDLGCYHLVLFCLKYILGIIWMCSILNKMFGLVLMFIFPVMLTAIGCFDGTIERVYHHYHHMTVTQATHLTQSRKKTIYGDLVCCFVGYFFLSMLLYPATFLTPFPFGLSIMCQVDFGLETHWPMQQLCRYWSGFLSIKLSLGIIVIFICERFCATRNNNNNNNNNDNNNDNNNNNNNSTNGGGFNYLCFATMFFMSNIILLALLFGINSFYVNIWRVFCWMMMYALLQMLTVRQLQSSSHITHSPTFARVLNFSWFFTSITDININKKEMQL